MNSEESQDISDHDPFSDATDDGDPDFNPNTEISSKKSSNLLDYFETKTANVKETNDQQPEPSCSNAENALYCNMPLSIKHRIENHPLLDGKYFQVVLPIKNTSNIEAQCKMCIPKIVILKGSLDVSTNFLKHFRNKHPDTYKFYVEYKTEKRNKRKLIGCPSEKDNNETKECIPKKLKQSTLLMKQSKTKGSQTEFDMQVINFLVNTMSPISIIENPSFLNLFKNFDVNVMCRKTSVKKIYVLYTQLINGIKNRTKDIKYFCTTADIWSAKRRSFFGVTLHWIDNEFKRHSCAIACKRFSGSHSFDKIAEMLENINLKFNLNSTNIVATITDNGSNFVKAFKEYGINIDNISDQDDEEDSKEESVLEFEDILSDESNDDNETVRIVLPKHLRCASHTLNLIATTDVMKAINSNISLRTRHNSAFNKCSALWKKASKPKSAEVIQEVLGHTLSYPVITRWNSTYDSIKQIISDKSKLPSLFTKLNLNTLKETELLYLEEYCHIMKPLTETLDKLQGEKSCFFGYLIPCIISLKNKWMKTKTNHGGQIILHTCLTSLNKRLSHILSLSDNDAIIASVTHPQFKTKWYKENTNVSLKNIQETVLRAIQSKSDNSVSSDDTDSKKSDDFFDFGNENTSATEIESAGSVNKQELEILKYLQDKRSDLNMLKEYSNISALFLKYNTPLTSSAPVERLFSFATIINAPRRHALNDDLFEQLVLLKANSYVSAE